MPGALDGSCQAALVFCAGTALSTGPNFAIFMHKSAQQICVFVIDHQIFIGAKLAGARAVKPLPALV